MGGRSSVWLSAAWPGLGFKILFQVSTASCAFDAFDALRISLATSNLPAEKDALAWLLLGLRTGAFPTRLDLAAWRSDTSHVSVSLSFVLIGGRGSNAHSDIPRSPRVRKTL